MAKVVTKVGLFIFVGGGLSRLILGGTAIDGLIVLTGWALTVGGIVTQGITSASPVGSSPHRLSEYINKYLLFCERYSKSKVCSYDAFSSCAAEIVKCIHERDPVIVFFPCGSTIWHSANVVATQGNGDKFMILEADQHFGWLSSSSMADLMRNDYGAQCKEDTGNYIIIRLFRR